MTYADQKWKQDASPDTLTDGAWVTSRGVQVWLPVEQATTQDVSGAGLLIACPTCHARVDQLCRTRTGRHRAPHASRLVRKRCPCGEVVKPYRTYCDPCRDAAAKQVTADYRARQPIPPRLCACGLEVERPRHYCDPCREERRRETYRRREARKSTRERRAASRAAWMRDGGRCWVLLGGDGRSPCGLPIDVCLEHAADRAEKEAA